MSYRAFLTIVAVFATGCMVPKSRLLKQQSETETCYEALRLENDHKKELASAVADLKTALGDLSAERKKLESEKGSLEGNLANLEQEVNARLAEVQKLTVEKSKLEKEREKLKEKTQTYNELMAKLKKEMKDKLIEVKRKGSRITVNMSDRILFDSGRAELKGSGQNTLKKIADILAKIDDRRIDVEGHTDNVPITGDLAEKWPTNWELSASRATNVVRYLEDNGVNPKRLAAVAKSKHRPRARNTSKTGRQLNRRIEIVLTPWDGQ